MIDPALYAAFVLATAVLMLIPGPNVALIVANSVAYGTRYGLLTLAGTASAMVPQLLLTALGMTALLGGIGDMDGLAALGGGRLPDRARRAAVAGGRRSTSRMWRRSRARGAASSCAGCWCR